MSETAVVSYSWSVTAGCVSRPFLFTMPSVYSCVQPSTIFRKRRNDYSIRTEKEGREGYSGETL